MENTQNPPYVDRDQSKSKLEQARRAIENGLKKAAEKINFRPRGEQKTHDQQEQEDIKNYREYKAPRTEQQTRGEIGSKVAFSMDKLGSIGSLGDHIPQDIESMQQIVGTLNQDLRAVDDELDSRVLKDQAVVAVVRAVNRLKDRINATRDLSLADVKEYNAKLLSLLPEVNGRNSSISLDVEDARNRLTNGLEKVEKFNMRIQRLLEDAQQGTILGAKDFKYDLGVIRRDAALQYVLESVGKGLANAVNEYVKIMLKQQDSVVGYPDDATRDKYQRAYDDLRDLVRQNLGENTSIETQIEEQKKRVDRLLSVKAT
jgi:hypothetical protein